MFGMKKIQKSDEHDLWAGNIAVPHLIFDDKSTFNENLGNIFENKIRKIK